MAGPRPAACWTASRSFLAAPSSTAASRLEEFDLDAALARHPALLLVDELAHTNAPGLPPRQALAGRRGAARRRHQRLHHAQHPAFREPERRRRPDHRGHGAGDGARLRCSSGPTRSSWWMSRPTCSSSGCGRARSTSPSRRARAIEQFFRKGNLIALRELALRRTAERVDAQMRGYMAEQGIRETWATGERLLVCIGPSPSAVRLVRAARRMAARLHAEWFAVHVETPRDQRLTPAEREDILRAMELAEQLGGRAGDAERAELGRRDPGVRAGPQCHPHRHRQDQRGRAGARSSAARCSTRWSGAAAASTCSPSPARRTRRASARPGGAPPGARRRREYAWAGAIAVVPTLLGAHRARHGRPVLADRRRDAVSAGGRGRRGPLPPRAGGRRVARWASPRSTSSSCTPSTPSRCRTSLRAHLRGDAGRRARDRHPHRPVRSQAEAARDRERRTAALYALSRDLAAARDRERRAAPRPRRSLRDTFASDARGAPARATGGARGRVVELAADALDERERAVAQWGFDHGQPAGAAPTRCPAAGALYVPLRGVAAARSACSALPIGAIAPTSAIPRGAGCSSPLAGQTAARARAAGAGGAEP